MFLFPFHMRGELGPGPTCCDGPVRKGWCGQEHHHHRASTGSEACWEEGEFKDQLNVCAAEHRGSRYADISLSYLKHTEELLKETIIG